jgi:nucleoside-diphosphate-sugar epimerase
MPSPRYDTSPARYVARIDRATGRELPGAIHADELLVHAHRDRHLVPMAAEVLASRLVSLTGSERLVRSALRGLKRAWGAVAAAGEAVTHDPAVGRATRRLLGFEHRDWFFRFRGPAPLPEAQRKVVLRALRQDARAALGATGRPPRLRVLLTGATGFLGKEILAQAAQDPHIAEVVCPIRSRWQRDPVTGRRRLESAARRGSALVRRLRLGPAAARKFHFVEGDIEKRGLGLRPQDRRRLLPRLTHVVHCAASVSFDEDYEGSFRANVAGSRNALGFSLDAQNAPRSAFVAHVAIETSYVHGRLGGRPAREGTLEFPRRFYNNFYEVTKAMAAVETERALWERGLRVIQILPSIVIGEARTGVNRGDTKVVNAPINAFGRAKAALDDRPHGWRWWLRAHLTALVATTFPADASAELNLVPVDRVAAGVLAALGAADAVGRRIHLASERRISAREMARVIEEELGLRVRMLDPTIARTVALPLARALLGLLGEGKLGRSLARLGGIFGGYSEWGQPVHAVGEDVRALALPVHRPDPLRALRMMCRYDRYVLRFGAVRDAAEVARREALWETAIDDIEFGTGRRAASLGAEEFRRCLERRVDFDRLPSATGSQKERAA